MDKVTAEVNGAPNSSNAGVLITTSVGAGIGHKLGPASPRRPIRFTVGEPGRRSTIWKAWSNQKKSDVYIASRMSAGVFTVSLHESGDWRLQWVAPDHQEVIWEADDPNSAEPGRILDRWRRPSADSVGWTDALSIWVPGHDVAIIPLDGEAWSDVQWIDAPGKEYIVEFRFFLVEPRMGVFDLTAAFQGGKAEADLVNGFRLANGEVLLLFAVNGPIGADLQQQLDNHRTRIRESHASFDKTPDRGPRVAIFTSNSEGHRNIWDLSVGLP